MGQMDTFEGRLAYARYLKQAHPEHLDEYLDLFTSKERHLLWEGLRRSVDSPCNPDDLQKETHRT